jgi:hypothetical protein
MGGKNVRVPGEVSPVRRLVVTTNGEKSAEAIVADQTVKGRINRSLEYDRERRNGLEHGKQQRKLPAVERNTGTQGLL